MLPVACLACQHLGLSAVSSIFQIGLVTGGVLRSDVPGA